MTVKKSSVFIYMIPADADTASGSISTSSRSAIIPVQTVAHMFAPNAIPQCQCDIATGVNITSKSYGTWTGRTADDLRAVSGYNKLMRVYSVIRGEEWPTANPVLLFEGYVRTIGASVNTSSNALSITLVHWLDDLNSYPLVAAYVNPDLLIAGDQSASHTMFANSTGGVQAAGQQPGLVEHLTGAETFNSSETYSDMWGKGIKRFLRTLITQGLGIDKNVRSGTQSCASLFNAPSQKALAALNRIEGDDFAYEFGFPTAIRADMPSIIKQSMLATMTKSSVPSFKRQTTWSALVGQEGLLTRLNLIIIPLVDRAIVVPDCRCPSQSYTVNITADDVFAVQDRSTLEEPVRGVILMGKPADSTNGQAAKEATATVKQQQQPVVSVSCWPEASVAVDRPGLFHMRNAPEWLSTVSIDITGDATRARAAETLPGTPDVTPQADYKHKNVGASATTGQIAMDMSRQLYAALATDADSANITTKLRFDICPGSTIHVLVDNELSPYTNKLAFSSASTAISFYGFVMQVASIISVAGGGPAQAYTTYTVSNIRSSEEQLSGEFSVPRPAAYENSFVGAPIVKEYAYANLPG
jgi:hypothetical protein